MLPFFGRCHIAYLPSGQKVLGVSKIVRLVDAYAKRLQIQERLTLQIAEIIDQTIHPDGVAVVVEGQHMCMSMRGVGQEGSKMVTSAMLGVFRESQDARDEVLRLIGMS